MNSINLIFYSHTCFQFSNRKSPTTISFWELALVAPCCSLICEMLLFEWIKSTRLGLECSSPQKSVHYIPEHMFYCSATLPGHWNSRKNRSEEPLAVARCGVRGHGFNLEEVSVLYTSFAMWWWVFSFSVPFLMPVVHSNHLYEVAVHLNCLTIVIFTFKMLPMASYIKEFFLFGFVSPFEQYPLSVWSFLNWEACISKLWVVKKAGLKLGLS